ncbi:aromatase/cyclase [Nocardia arthritidis]|nr:aromatase/cyclase [Nocardia arthritidis]
MVSDSVTQVVEEAMTAHAPAEVLYDLVLDVAAWPQYHRPAIHAEVSDRTDRGDLVNQWSMAGEHAVRNWQVRRTFDRAGLRIEFAHESSASPMSGARGGWRFEPLGPDSTRVVMWHEFETPGASADTVTRLTATTRTNTLAYLDTLKDTAERGAELAELVVSFEDPLFVAGSVEHAYDYLYRADKWPERIPHVRSLVLTEEIRNIQFFDMETVGPDGNTHTTRSVRICLPPNKIVYKQLAVPPLLSAHTGHWKFTGTPEGIIVSARHTATIEPKALHLLGPGTTVRDARRFLRRVLAANSMTNLRLAKEFAEEFADA